MSEGSLAFNPEFDPDGAEGGVDTNLLPWLPLSGVAGFSLKPLRASMESGMFSVIVRLEKGAVLERLLSLSGMDLLVLSGALDYADDSGESHLEPGIWGYLSANTCMQRLTAAEESELLVNCYGAFAMLSPGNQVDRLVTSADIRQMALQAGISMVPNTLAECMVEREPYTGDGEPLAIAGKKSGHLVASVTTATADTTSIDLVAEAVTVAGRDARAAAYAALVQLQAGHIGRIIVVARREVGAVVDIITDTVSVRVRSASTTDSAGVGEQAARSCRVIVVAGEQVGASIQWVADAIIVVIRTTTRSGQEDIIEADGLTIGVGPQREPDLQRVACRNRVIRQDTGCKVIEDVEHLGHDTVKDDVAPDEVRILKVSGFFNVSGEQNVAVSRDVDFAAQPHTVEVGVPAFEEVGAAVVVDVEVVGLVAEGDTPLRIAGSGVRVAIVTIAYGIGLEVLRIDHAGAGALTTEVGLAAIRVDIVERERIAIVTRITEVDAAAIVLRRSGIVVAGNGAGATLDLRIVADTIAIHIGCTSAAALAEYIGLVAEAVAVTGRDAGSTAYATFVNLVAEAIAVAGRDAGAATDATLIELEAGCIDRIGIVAGRQVGAVVDIITDAVTVRISSTGTAADAEGVELIARTVAIAGQDAGTTADTAFVDGAARAIGRVIEVAGRHIGAVVRIVTNAVGIAVGSIATAHATGIDLIAKAIAVTGGDAGSAADAALIGEEASVIGKRIEVAGREIGAVVEVVTDTITVQIRSGATAYATGVELVAITVAVASRYARSTADAAFIEVLACLVERAREVAGIGVDAVVGAVTAAVAIHVGTIATAHAAGIKLVAVAVAVVRRDAGTTTDAAFVHIVTSVVQGVIEVAGIGIGAVVDVVTDTVAVQIRTATAADAAGIDLVAEAVTVAGRDAATSAHATGVEGGARAIGRVVVVARGKITAVVHRITDAVTIGVDTGSATVATGVNLVAEAVAVAGRDARAATNTALVRVGAGHIAGIIEVAGRQVGAVIRVVTDTIGVCIRGARTTAYTQGIELVAGTIAITGQNAGTTAYTALIEAGTWAIGCVVVVAGCHVRAIVQVVTDTVGVHVRTVAAANAAGVELVAEAVAVAGRNARTTADAAFVELEAGAVG